MSRAPPCTRLTSSRPCAPFYIIRTRIGQTSTADLGPVHSLSLSFSLSPPFVPAVISSLTGQPRLKSGRVPLEERDSVYPLSAPLFQLPNGGEPTCVSRTVESGTRPTTRETRAVTTLRDGKSTAADANGKISRKRVLRNYYTLLANARFFERFAPFEIPKW